MGRFLFLVSAGVWLGTVVSFSYVIVPVVRQILHPEASLEVLRELFPRYYMLGLLSGLTALAALSLLPGNVTILTASDRLLLAFPVSLALLCTVVAQYYVHPRMVEAHGRDEEAHERLVRLSAMLNHTVLAMLVLAFATFTTR